MKATRLDHGSIVTLRDQGRIETKADTIDVIPA